MTWRRRGLAVAGLSAGAVSFEILLVRVFAIEYFHHFAYMAIGVAMLGYGAGGTLAAVTGLRGRSDDDRWFGWVVLLAVVTLLVSPTVVDRVSLDPTQLAWDVAPWLRLAAVYIVLALPFLATALATVLALAATRRRRGAVYGASFLGAGLGAAIGLFSLWWLEPDRALMLPALLAATGAAVLTFRRPYVIRPWYGWMTFAAVTLAGLAPPWSVESSPYKPLPQVLNLPDAAEVGRWPNPAGWLVAVSAPTFRFAPGLSLAYRGAFPRQTGLFLDGDLAGAVTDWSPGSAELLRWLPASLPYALGPPQRVLVLGSGGGLDVAGALAHGSRVITAVEPHPAVAKVASGASPPDDATASLQWVVADARSHTATTSDTFDLIVLGTMPGGATAVGLHSLNEDYRHTVDAYGGYLRRLDHGGVLSTTSWLEIPPRTAVRQVLTLAEAVRRIRPDAVHRALVVARSWGTVTVLAKPTGFRPDDVDALRAWAMSRRVDLDWYPGVDAPSSSFHLMDEATLYDATEAAVTGGVSARQFAAEYPFHVAPVSDARPYPNHFIRAGSLMRLLRRPRGDWLSFAEWGYLALVATLAQSVVVAGTLLLVPVVVRRRRTQPEHPPFALVSYFGAIGLGYLSAEVAAIQPLVLLLGHPVYAVALVIGSFLIVSGLGSIWSDRVGVERAGRVTAAIAGALAVGSVGLLPLVHVAEGFPLPLRAGIGVAVMAPLALAMGFPFALGLRTIPETSERGVAWAWAINGFASVVAAPLAALLAVEFGSRAVLGFAAATYAVAAVAHRGRVAFVGPLDPPYRLPSRSLRS